VRSTDEPRDRRARRGRGRPSSAWPGPSRELPDVACRLHFAALPERAEPRYLGPPDRTAERERPAPEGTGREEARRRKQAMGRRLDRLAVDRAASRACRSGTSLHRPRIGQVRRLPLSV
jgi:hypothetical protein